MNIQPVAVKVAPISNDTFQLPPHNAATVPETRPRIRDATIASPTPASSRLARPRTPDASSSACPESSWARVARVSVKMAPSAVRKPPSARLRQASKPSTVEMSKAGPKIRPSAGLAPIAAASAARLCWLGKTSG